MALTGLIAGVSSLAIAALNPTVAKAASLIFDLGDTCTAINCNAGVLNGISQRNAFGDSVPFTIQIFADANQCLRLDVTSESAGADQEIVLTSPSGRVWINDDRVALDNRPLVKAITDVKGYYNVQINFFNGRQPVNSLQLFTLVYGLYNGTNPNCAAPTPPSVPLAAPVKSK